jgi:hypothetical protein
MTPSTAPEPKPSLKARRRSTKLFNRRSLPWLIIAVLLLVSLFLFAQYRSAQNKLVFGNSNQQVSSLISRVRKLVVLPANETPTVATVLHADRLKAQSFFTNALDGDKVLVYNREKEAILYRPSTNQIVTIAPVTVTPDGTNTLTK